MSALCSPADFGFPPDHKPGSPLLDPKTGLPVPDTGWSESEKGRVLAAAFKVPVDSYIIAEPIEDVATRGTQTFKNARILIIDRPIKDALYLLPLFEAIGKGPLIIVAEDAPEVLADARTAARAAKNGDDDDDDGAELANALKRIKLVPLRPPAFGVMRTELLEDLAAMTGGKRIDSNGGSLEAISEKEVGSVGEVELAEDKATIKAGQGNGTDLAGRLEVVRRQLAAASAGDGRVILGKRIKALESKTMAIDHAPPGAVQSTAVYRYMLAAGTYALFGDVGRAEEMISDFARHCVRYVIPKYQPEKLQKVAAKPDDKKAIEAVAKAVMAETRDEAEDEDAGDDGPADEGAEIAAEMGGEFDAKAPSARAVGPRSLFAVWFWICLRVHLRRWIAKNGGHPTFLSPDEQGAGPTPTPPDIEALLKEKLTPLEYELYRLTYVERLTSEEVAEIRRNQIAKAVKQAVEEIVQATTAEEIRQALDRLGNGSDVDVEAWLKRELTPREYERYRQTYVECLATEQGTEIPPRRIADAVADAGDAVVQTTTAEAIRQALVRLRTKIEKLFGKDSEFRDAWLGYEQSLAAASAYSPSQILKMFRTRKDGLIKRNRKKFPAVEALLQRLHELAKALNGAHWQNEAPALRKEFRAIAEELVKSAPDLENAVNGLIDLFNCLAPIEPMEPLRSDAEDDEPGD